MSRIRAEVLSAEECLARSTGTQAGTEGWWFHGTTARTAVAILSGQRKLHSPFWLTRNPAGASQHHGHIVLWCTVNLRRSLPAKATDDKYHRKGGDEGLDQPYPWIGIVEGRVFIASAPPEDASTPESCTQPGIPTVGEEFEKITGVDPDTTDEAAAGDSDDATPTLGADT